MLEALGINETFFFQLGIFLCTFVFLSQVVFKPYYKAYRMRKNILNPEEDLHLKELKEDTKEKQVLYEKKVQKLNQDCQNFYTQIKKEALLEKESLLQETLKKSQDNLKTSKKTLQLETKDHLTNLNQQAYGLSQIILKKILDSKLK